MGASASFSPRNKILNVDLQQRPVLWDKPRSRFSWTSYGSGRMDGLFLPSEPGLPSAPRPSFLQEGPAILPYTKVAGRVKAVNVTLKDVL